VKSALLLLAGVSLVLAACGGGKSSAPPTTTRTVTPAPTASQPSTTTAPSGPGALQAEANAAATGDIPDNQVFLVFRNRATGYTMKYPEGWAQQGAGGQVTFRDKNNVVRVVVAAGGAPTAASVRTDVHALRGAAVSGTPQRLTLAGSPAFKVTYTTVSAANAVTGKRVHLAVDRYYLWKGGRRAVVDLGTPVGVDNVDAYRLMIESFRWG
jgi:hypothetical protein